MSTDYENPQDDADVNDPQAAPAGTTRWGGFRLRLPRRQMHEYMTTINDLLLDGYTSRQIAANLGLAKTTVHRWLLASKRETLAKLADGNEMLLAAVARYDSIYREAMKAWRNSKNEKMIQHEQDSDMDGYGSGRKNSTRTESQSGDVQFLAQARAAVDAICKLVAKSSPRAGKAETADLRHETNGRHKANSQPAANGSTNGTRETEAMLAARHAAVLARMAGSSPEVAAEPWDQAGQAGTNGDICGTKGHSNGTK